MDKLESKKLNHYAVILCGGTGPRLWPLSRASHPKQFLNLFSPQSLLQETVHRAQKIVPSKNIFVVTNNRYLPQISLQLKKIIPSQNIISEPQKKNTSMAILLAVARIESIDPSPFVVTSFPSDHYIQKIPKFIKDIKKSAQIAINNHQIVLLGAKPTFPNPAYGYILSKKTQANFHHITKFVEKPTPPIAKKLISQNAFWNSGIYTFTSETILSEFAKYQKTYYQLYQKLLDNPTNQTLVNKIYQLSPSLAIDTAISEKSEKMAVIPINFDWSDIGQWNTIHQKSSKDKNKNATLLSNTKFVSIDSTNCLIHGQKDKLIGLVDINNLAVIDTPDALLICNLSTDASYKMRDLIGEIVKDKKTADYFLKTYDPNSKK